MDITTLLIIIAVLLLLGGIIVFNRLIQLKNTRTQSLADIDTQAKLRFDLVPNLVETVKGYAKHEDTLLTNVTKARNMMLSAGSLHDKANADAMLTSSLKTLFAVAENYPDLKANTNFLHLQQELSSIETKLAASRRFFNNATKEYNTLVMSFPHLIIAKLFNFHEESYFELGSDAERENVTVSI